MGEVAFCWKTHECRPEPSTMRILIRDGRLNRAVPVDADVGKIEINLAGEEYTVTVPDEVTVRRRD